MSSNSLLWSTIRPPPPGPAVTEKCPGTALCIHTPIVFFIYRYDEAGDGWASPVEWTYRRLSGYIAVTWRRYMTLGCWTFWEKEEISSGQSNGTNSVHRKKYLWRLCSDIIIIRRKIHAGKLGDFNPCKGAKKKVFMRYKRTLITASYSVILHSPLSRRRLQCYKKLPGALQTFKRNR